MTQSKISFKLAFSRLSPAGTHEIVQDYAISAILCGCFAIATKSSS